MQNLQKTTKLVLLKFSELFFDGLEKS